MGNLPQEILAEKQNVERTLTLLDEAMARVEKTGVELTAIATCLHNIYNGIENILKQLLRPKNIDVPPSSTWHKDLLNQAISAHIIPDDLGDLLFDYLGFRHFFVHGYGFMLDKEQITELAQNIPAVWNRFINAINE